jgi:hypothetical protein
MVQTNTMLYHPGQAHSVLAGANSEDIVCGRGWGKSEGPGGKRLADWADAMPRASIGIIGATYVQLKDRTLPPVYRAWERLGYRRDIHYWVGRKPPSYLNIPLPFYAPDIDKNTIYWYNGACFKLISQDRPGSANGSTLDALYGDEAKLLNKVKFDDEIDKANRGNVREFSDLACHHGTLFMTDMPTTPQAKWILDRKELQSSSIQKGTEVLKMHELLNIIKQWQLHINKLIYKKLMTEDVAEIKALNRRIYSAERKINELRRKTVNYTEGSSLQNIHNLGIDLVEKWKRDSLDIVFRTQVLNELIYTVTNSFYPQFDLDYHGYDAYDYNYVDGLGLYLPDGIINDSRIDGDVAPNRPLDIGMDAGGRINCLVVGQEHPEAFRYLKSFYVKKPKLINDVVEEFCDYYQHHRCKEVNFYYDHTFIGTDATRLYSYADEVTKVYVKNKWTVNNHYIGQQPKQTNRYRMWSAVMRELVSRNMKPVRFNRNNCSQLIISMQLAGAIEKRVEGKGIVIQKDKRPEGRLDVPSEEATHLTDAMDTLYIGRFQHQIGYTMPTLEGMIA